MDKIASHDGDLMTVKDFKGAVEWGGFIDYDGFGYPAIGDECDPNTIILPSKPEKIPSWATHILWFNR